ncbi:MAG: 6-phosphogluconolactonase [Pseudomonadota bacterium]
MHAHATDAQVADFFETRLRRALKREPGGVSVAFPGGSTPFPIIAELTTRDLKWSRVNIYPTDDRMVDEDHEASNFGRLRDLLEPVGALVTPLAEGFDVPHFSLVWLGMGKDGHIASLFPGDEMDPQEEHATRRVTPDPMPEDAPFDRVTLTVPPIISADELVFVMRGVEKRRVFDESVRGSEDTPVRRLLAARQAANPGLVTCFT